MRLNATDLSTLEERKEPKRQCSVDSYDSEYAQPQNRRVRNPQSNSPTAQRENQSDFSHCEPSEQSGFSRLINMITRHREYLGRVKHEGELIMQELTKMMNVSMFN